jgi:hypothetical protein
MNLFWRLLLAIEMIIWHNLQIKITTETEDTLRTDSTFCSDMAIWEQETGVLYQIVVYGGQGENIQTHLDSMLASYLEDSDR